MQGISGEHLDEGCHDAWVQALIAKLRAPFAQNPDPQASAECTSIRITRSAAHGEKHSRQSRRRFSARGGGK